MFINKHEVLNKDYLKVVEKVVTCPMCDGIIISPVQCEVCGKCFCKRCYDNAVKTVGSCPSGCPKNKNKDCRVLRLTLAKLKFYCHNNCGEEIPYDNLEDHYSSGCSQNGSYLEYQKLKKDYEELLSKVKMLRKNKGVKNEPFSFSLISAHHIHPLVFCKTSRVSWICDVCRRKPKIFETQFSYYCTLCDFDLCKNCSGAQQNN